MDVSLCLSGLSWQTAVAAQTIARRSRPGCRFAVMTRDVAAAVTGESAGRQRGVGQIICTTRLVAYLTGPDRSQTGICQVVAQLRLRFDLDVAELDVDRTGTVDMRRLDVDGHGAFNQRPDMAVVTVGVFVIEVRRHRPVVTGVTVEGGRVRLIAVGSGCTGPRHHQSGRPGVDILGVDPLDMDAVRRRRRTVEVTDRADVGPGVTRSPIPIDSLGRSGAGTVLVTAVLTASLGHSAAPVGEGDILGPVGMVGPGSAMAAAATILVGSRGRVNGRVTIGGIGCSTDVLSVFVADRRPGTLTQGFGAGVMTIGADQGRATGPVATVNHDMAAVGTGTVDRGVGDGVIQGFIFVGGMGTEIGVGAMALAAVVEANEGRVGIVYRVSATIRRESGRSDGCEEGAGLGMAVGAGVGAETVGRPLAGCGVVAAVAGGAGAAEVACNRVVNCIGLIGAAEVDGAVVVTGAARAVVEMTIHTLGEVERVGMPIMGRDLLVRTGVCHREERVVTTAAVSRRAQLQGAGPAV